MTKLLRQPDGTYRHEFTTLRGDGERRIEVRSLEEMEADFIRIAFDRFGGRVTEATTTEVASRLGIGPMTLKRKIREYDLLSPPERESRARRLLRRLGFNLAERRGRFQIRREGSKVDETVGLDTREVEAWIKEKAKRA